MRKGPKAFLVYLLPLVVGCASSRRGEEVDPNILEWPIGIAADPASDFIYVVSSNFDAGRTGSTVVPIDLKSNQKVPSSAVEVGSFAGQMVVVKGPDGRGAMGYVAVRDGDQVEFFRIEWEEGEPKLSCGGGKGQKVPRCDPTFRTDLIASPEDLVGKGRDPFAIALATDKKGRAIGLYAASILDGTFAVLPLDEELRPRPGVGIRLSGGLHSIAEGPMRGESRLVFVSNRFSSTIHLLEVAQRQGSLEVTALDPINLGHVSASGDYFRGLAMSRDRQTLFAAYRSPPSLVVFDIGLEGKVTLRGIVPLSGGPAEVAVAETLRGELVYVTDFSGDSVYCVDPRTLEVIDRIPLRGGPYEIVIVRNDILGFLRAYVPLFEDGKVAVIDLDQNSPTWHQVLFEVR